MITWWNVSIVGQPSFGFSTKNNVVIGKFPDYGIVGKDLSVARNWFILQNAKVVKIADQYEPGDNYKALEPVDSD